MLLFIIIIKLAHAIPMYAPQLSRPPAVDIGATTQAAAQMLIRGENPYQSQTIAVLGDNPARWGYKYGPMMILGYVPSAFAPDTGFKIIELLRNVSLPRYPKTNL